MKKKIKEIIPYVIILLVVILIRTFIATPARVDGESMEKTLYNGEIVLYGNKYQVFNDSKILKKYGLLPPRIMLFRSKVLNKKGIKLEYREEINDLIKDIFRHVY